VFADVAPGKYWLFSGNDLNNDGAVCGLGESCGAFINLSQPKVVILEGNLKAQDFDANFKTMTSDLPAMITAANSHFASTPRLQQSP
jgi:serine protease